MSCNPSTSMLASPNSFDLYKGLTAQFKLTVTKDGEKYDLTGASLFLTVKCSVSETQNTLQLTVGNGITLAADPRDGTATIVFTAAQTQSLGAGSFQFDIVLQTAGGERYMLVGPGTIKVYQGVTRF